MLKNILIAAAVMMGGAAETAQAAPAALEQLRSVPEVQDAGSYYDGIDMSLRDDAMIKQLYQLVSKHSSISYKQVWSAFVALDEGLDNCDAEEVEDIYGGFCYREEQECGNYHGAGDCFNREHSFPKSWWGGFSKGAGAQTDLFHLRPADGYINAVRSNYPFGDVDEPTYTGPTGALFGPCAASNNAPEGTKCFCPPAEWKGDLARGYFYLSVAYRNAWSCCEEAGTDKWNLNKWEEDVLRTWHEVDPVSSTESARNDAIYANWQHNRNPFIDHPELVNSISDF